MYSLNSKKRFKKLSILVLVPYIILCVTAGGFHAFDESAYHGHTSMNIIQKILFLSSMTAATVLLSSAIMIITKTIVLSANGLRVRPRKYNYLWMLHASCRTHPYYV